MFCKCVVECSWATVLNSAARALNVSQAVRKICRVTARQGRHSVKPTNDEVLTPETESPVIVEEIKDVRHVDEEEDTPIERAIKRKQSAYKTSYGKAMEEEEPEDEEAVLEYYVKKAVDSMEEFDDAEYSDVMEADKRLFFKMVDIWIKDAGEARRGHREFLQVAMNNLERFNVQSEPKAYLKILECYPQSVHTGMRRNKWFKSVWQDKILDHELGVRLLSIMNKYRAEPSDELYNTCTRLFGIYSRATLRARLSLYWFPRILSFQAFPVAERLIPAMDPVEIAFRGLRQASPGLDASYERFEVDEATREALELKDVELDCIISVQTDKQKELLKCHDVIKPVFVEGPHMVYFHDKKIQYFVMRADPIAPEKVTKEARILTDREWWMKFYKKDIETMASLNKSGEVYSKECFLPTVNVEKGLSVVDQKANEIVKVVDDTKQVEGAIYGIAATDFKSPDALRSWVKGLHPKNPTLSQVTVLFNNRISFLSGGYTSGRRKEQ